MQAWGVRFAALHQMLQMAINPTSSGDAVDFYTWASTDDRVAAVMPWSHGRAFI